MDICNKLKSKRVKCVFKIMSGIDRCNYFKFDRNGSFGIIRTKLCANYVYDGSDRCSRHTAMLDDSSDSLDSLEYLSNGIGDSIHWIFSNIYGFLMAE